MRRVLVSGISGAGKTTVATHVARALNLPRHELDALHHGPGWVKRPSFEADVARFAADDAWVTEDQYVSRIGELLWERADTLVWLDLPRATVMRQVVARSVVRAIRGDELWNGNRERVGEWLDPGHPMRWAWSHHGAKRAETAERAARHRHLRVLRLDSRRAVDAWLAGDRALTPLSATGGCNGSSRGSPTRRCRGRCSRGRGR